MKKEDQMKKVLLATTAIIAAGVIAAPAMAAEKKAAGPIALKVGGYMNQSISNTSQDDAAGQPGNAQHNTNMGADAEVHFTGSTTLDNGVTVGVNMQLEGDQSTDQMDEHFAWFSGSFGKVIIGSENGAGYLSRSMSSVPGPQFISTWSSAIAVYSRGGNTAANGVPSVSGDADKLTYYSPKMSGLQVGASYTWDNCEDGSCTTNSDANAGQQSNIWELAATYGGNTGKDGVAYNVSAIYIKGDLEVAAAGSEDQKVWNIGGDLTVSGFRVMASYGKDNQGTSASSTDATEWTAGVRSSSGAWSYGVAYGNDSVEQGAGAGEDTRKTWIGGVSYAFGPGITLSGAIENNKIEASDNAAADENSATSIHIGTSLFF
jgi:outer membrane protein OmpU